jgi:hypothetical protein
MIVVADSGPLHYLILLEQIELLQRFYGQVLTKLRLKPTSGIVPTGLLIRCACEASRQAQLR